MCVVEQFDCVSVAVRKTEVFSLQSIGSPLPLSGLSIGLDRDYPELLFLL